MTGHVLTLEPGLRDDLWRHLLPAASATEQAAFLFCTSTVREGGLDFAVTDSAFLGQKDFAAQHEDYLELTDETRIRLIKRAHDLAASLIEFHSHPGPWPASFSHSDRLGLEDTVPHMRWRLKGRPYGAIVVAPTGFDALVWANDPRIPEPLAGIRVGPEFLTPTNASLWGWNHD
jgi:hypothetical protein